MYLITGASGHLGHKVIEKLITKVAPNQVVATVRDPERASDLTKMGVIVRRMDYNKPETLKDAFAGVTRVLLISSNELGRRFEQHKRVVDAAKSMHVERLAYTSILHADTSKMVLAEEHRLTEAYIKASGVPYSMLRNGWYVENHSENLKSALEHGAVVGSVGQGKIAAASRADYAEAAVAVLTGDSHRNKIYELSGDTAFTLTELAAEISRHSKTKIIYTDMPKDTYQNMLLGFGLPKSVAEMLADSDAWAAKGALGQAGNDLHTLIGHATTPWQDVIRRAVTTR